MELQQSQQEYVDAFEEGPTRSTLVHSPVSRFQSHAALLWQEVMACLVSLLTASAITGCLCERIIVVAALRTFHTRAVPSSDPVRRRDPVGCSHMQFKDPLWPRSTVMGCRVTTFHKRAVQSLDIVTSKSPACKQGSRKCMHATRLNTDKELEDAFVLLLVATHECVLAQRGAINEVP
jgi:hypothetical protein